MFQGVFESAWAGSVLWAALYISDYALTLSCARMYGAQTNIVFEGSYEITPAFQADVDALRRVSPRFVIALIGSSAYVWVVRQFAGPSTRYFDLYVGVLGAMVLLQTTVHMRHLRNWFLFAKGASHIQGRLKYSRGLLLRMSALELLLFAGLYGGLFFVTKSVFCLGGALACGVLSLKHYRLARRHQAPVAKAA